MESIEPTNLARAAPSSLITDLEFKVHPDSDVSRRFVYKMVTLEEDELFYEANDLDEDLARKLHRRVRRNNQGQVIAFTQTTVDTKLGEEEISIKKDDLKRMSKDDLVEHLQYQILHHHALSEQRNMLWVLLNKAEASRTLATVQLEELADDQDDLRHSHSQLRQEAASLRQRVRELEVRTRSTRSSRQVTFDSTMDNPRRDEHRDERREERRESLRRLPRERDDSDDENHYRLTPFSGISETREQHTMGIPKPPVLTDGITPSFESWKFQMLNKFETNADHYSRPTRAAEEAAKIGYAVTRMEGKAADHFFPWMRAKRRAGEEVTIEGMMKLLEGVLDDPDKRITARKDLRKLAMKPFGDFNSFLADYTKLANESRFELDQWKEDFHDKLYDNLRVQMEIYLDDETVTFDQYCGFAKAYARGLSSKEINRKERSGNNANTNTPRGRRGGGIAGIAPQKAQAPATSKATATDKADKTFVCYKCGRSGHIARNCLRNTENKVVDTEKPERGVVTDSENESA
jgi:hypothetical protein